MMLFVVEKEKH